MSFFLQLYRGDDRTELRHEFWFVKRDVCNAEGCGPCRCHRLRRRRKCEGAKAGILRFLQD